MPPTVRRDADEVPGRLDADVREPVAVHALRLLGDHPLDVRHGVGDGDRDQRLAPRQGERPAVRRGRKPDPRIDVREGEGRIEEDLAAKRADGHRDEVRPHRGGGKRPRLELLGSNARRQTGGHQKPRRSSHAFETGLRS